MRALATGRHSVARAGFALLAAVSALALLGALALALHALALREGRAARRATLVARAANAAEGALAQWEAQMAAGEAVADAGPPGTERELAGAAGEAADAQGELAVRVTLVTLAGAARLLVAEGRAVAGAEVARRRVALLLVPSVRLASPADSGAAGSAGADTTRVARPVLVRAPARAWLELP